MFKLDDRSFKKYQEFWKKAPRTARRVEAATLNTLAFGTKKNIQKKLGSLFVIRNPAFMKSSIRVEMANPSKLYSIVGSVERKGFTGWEEQQTGKPADKHRVSTTAARSGDWQSIIVGKARLKPSADFISIRDYIGGRFQTRAQRTIAMLRDSKKQRKPFIVTRRDKRKVGIKKQWEPGLYGFAGNKLMRLQRFGKSWKPTKRDWMGDSLRLTAKQNEYFKTFVGEFERMIAKAGVK